MTEGGQNLVYVVSGVQKSLAFEWTALELCKKYRLTFILLNPSVSPLEDFLIKHGIHVLRITFRGKKDSLIAASRLFFYFLLKRPAIVHAHLLEAQLLGLSTAWLAGIKKRIYTRHNSNFHQIYFPKGVKYDLWSNRFSTHIISISQATFKTLTQFESVNGKKIREIYHGFELSFFKNVNKNNVDLLRSKWKIPIATPCVGVIARHIEWKGIQYIVPAFKKLLVKYPNAILILANANGPYHETIMNFLAGIARTSYVIIPFEEDIVSLYALFDIYVHTPVDELSEAFGQTYIEALAAGVASVFTKSGVAVEFIEHKKNAWVVDFKNSDQILEGMLELLQNNQLRTSIITAGYQSVQSSFGLEPMIKKLEELYEE